MRFWWHFTFTAISVFLKSIFNADQQTATNFDSMFADNRVGIHKTADDVWKDLIVDDRRTQMFHKHFYLQDKYYAQ